ncbi:MAG: NosD domain-containing protein [Armatimonadota bacterium]
MLTWRTGRVVCCLILTVILNAPAFSGVIYVDRNRTEDGDGFSWPEAKTTVGAGLAAASGGDEVWVAVGLYTERVTLAPGIGLYGGFAGGEISKDMRNPSANPTILDGLKRGNVVLVLRDGGPDTVLDGFTIRGGSWAKGAGVYCTGCSPTISHNIITGNAASEQGGGIYCTGGAPVISDNLISDNTAPDYGGGVCCLNSSATITRNVIEHNQAEASSGSLGRGGGVFCDAQSSINLNGNNIIGNIGSLGGGVYCISTTSTIANNCILTNGATNTTQGGGIFCNASPLIANNTICGNTASSGGGIYCSMLAAPTLSNNIIASNSSGILKSDSQTLQVSANCVYGNAAYNYLGWQTDPTGFDGNISVNPKLVGLIHIQLDSPCIDKGDDSYVQSGWKDIDDQKRLQGASVDIGADEYGIQAALSGIAQARQAENGREVAISGVIVSAAFSGFYYIESDDRSCGIRVEQLGHGAVVGSRVDVHGVMRTNPDGERYIEVTAPG